MNQNDANLTTTARPASPQLSGFIALLFGVFFSPIAILAGLIIYGLSRDEESNSFGWILLWAGVAGSIAAAVIFALLVSRGLPQLIGYTR